MKEIKGTEIRIGDYICIYLIEKEDNHRTWDKIYGKIEKIEEREDETIAFEVNFWVDFLNGKFKGVDRYQIAIPLCEDEHRYYILTEKEFYETVGKCIIIGGLGGNN